MTSRLGKRARAVASVDPQAQEGSSAVKRRLVSSIEKSENVDSAQSPIGRDSSQSKTPRSGCRTRSSKQSTHTDCQLRASKPKSNGVGETTTWKSTESCAFPEIFEDSENSIQLPTPKTPRHKDALSKRVQVTPSHRYLFKDPLTPRTPHTPHTPRASASPAKSSSIYNNARRLFAVASEPLVLIGRDNEKDQLHQQLSEKVDSKRGACLYMSGPPGTGKSALVREVCKSLPTKGLESAYLNCVGIRKSEDILVKLSAELCSDDLSRTQDRSLLMANLRSRFLWSQTSPRLSFLIILDEVDHLLSVDPELVQTLFEWALQENSTLVVVAIANALDLTHRFLPRLRARNLRPQLLPLLPYTSDQIQQIVTSKLRSLLPENIATESRFTPFLHPAAIQLVSKKVASHSGDLRKAFDIIRQSINLVEAEVLGKRCERTSSLSGASPIKSPLSENPNLASSSRDMAPASDKVATLSLMSAPRVMLAHVSKVSAIRLSHGTSQRLISANLQQKAVLAAAISTQTPKDLKSSPAVFDSSVPQYVSASFKQLHHIYRNVCDREKSLQPLTFSEFADVLEGLMALGLVQEEKLGGTVRPGTPSKQGRVVDRRVTCLVDKGELLESLAGAQSSILSAMVSGY